MEIFNLSGLLFLKVLLVIGLINLVVFLVLYKYYFLAGIRVIINECRQIREGDLTIRSKAKIPLWLKELAEEISRLRNVFRDFTLENQVGSGQVAAVAEHITICLEKLEKGADCTYDNTRLLRSASGDMFEQMRKTVNEMNDSLVLAQRIGDSGKKVMEMGSYAVANANHVLLETSEAADRLDHVRTSSEELKSVINRLIDAASNVDQIVDQVGRIADLTKMLALNATIEAARAGEHGKGFAVVAGEVQRLADQVSLNVKDIGGLLSTIQNQAGNVHAVALQEIEQVSLGVQATFKAKDSMEEITKFLEEVLAKTREINELVQKQDRISSQVLSNINQMTYLREQTEEYVTEVSARVEEERCSIQEIASVGSVLLKASADLTKVASGFILEEEGSIEGFEAVQGILKRTAQESINKSADQLASLYREVLENSGQLEAIWSNRRDGTFIISLPPAGIVNASGREWWQKAIKGIEYISPVYVSAITRKPCRTVAIPLWDGDKIIGVLGADVRLNQIS